MFSYHHYKRTASAVLLFRAAQLSEKQTDRIIEILAGRQYFLRAAAFYKFKSIL